MKPAVLDSRGWFAVFAALSRHSMRHPWQALLCILGVALGVAVVVAIDVAADSAKDAHSAQGQAANGFATHRVVGGPNGVPESAYTWLRVELGMRSAVPRLSAVVAMSDGLRLTLSGVDPFARNLRARTQARGFDDGGGARVGLGLLARPDGVVVGPELGLSTGATLSVTTTDGRRTSLTVTAVAVAEDALGAQFWQGRAIVDIATAQIILGKPGWLDSIDLILSGPEGAQEAAALQAKLPPGLLLQPANDSLANARELTRAFDTNLDMLGVLALLVGLLLVYNTMTFAVVQRRHQFGVLRALGVTRGELITGILLEALALALVAGAVGTALGLELAERLSTLVERTVNDLYYDVVIRELSVRNGTLVKAWILAIGGTLLAALMPAWEAAKTTPSAALRRSVLEEKSRRLTPWLALAGVAIAATGLGILALPGRDLALAFASLFLTVLGCVGLIPWLLVGVVWVAAKASDAARMPLVSLSIRGVGANLTRSAVAVAALSIALSTTVGVGLMVSSFRGSVDGWLSQSLQADAYLSMPGSLGRSELPASVIATVEALPGVAALSLGRGSDLRAPFGPVHAIALRLAPSSADGFELLQGQASTAWKDFKKGAVMVSEPLWYRRGFGAGSTIELLTLDGFRSFDVVGVYRDYGSEHGSVLIDMSIYRRDFGDETVGSAGIYLAPGATLDAVSAKLANLRGVQLRSSAALRELSLAVFDRTFVVTRVLEALTIVVAFIGVLSALMALQLERSRELGLLRALGVTRSRVASTVFIQTGTMGLTAGLFAIPIGLGVGVFLVQVVNRRAFGWSMGFEWSSTLALQVLVLAVFAAVLAGIYPALRLALTAPADALRAQ